MTNFPTSLDTLSNPSSTDTTAAVDHAAQHANANDAIEALEAKLGINSSTAVDNTVLRGVGAGQSEWGKIDLGDVNASTGTGSFVFATSPTIAGATLNTATINNPTLSVDTIAESTSAAGVTIDGVLLKDSKVNGSYITDDTVSDTQLDYPRWWQEIARTTLGVAGDNLTISGIPLRKYLQIKVALLPSGQLNAILRLNNDSGSNYSRRNSVNGAADATAASQTSFSFSPSTGTFAHNGTIELTNQATQEKILSAHIINLGGAGAGAAPDRAEIHGKWANTTDAITRVDVINSGTGDFAAGSEIVILGHD